MVRVTINGTEAQVPEERTILQAAKTTGVGIPTLCHHEALSPYGSCRLCIVEIKKGKRSRIVTSCNHPVEEGMEVSTQTPAILGHRKMLLELLLARCPNVPVVRAMARQAGIEKPRFRQAKSDCLLCGLCVRACEEKIEASAISFVNRGTDEDVSTAFNISSETCIGCGACASVCPTGAITMERVRGLMKIGRFNTAKQLHTCPSCGSPCMTELHLAWIEGRLGSKAAGAELCIDCRRSQNADAARVVASLKSGARDRTNGVGAIP